MVSKDAADFKAKAEEYDRLAEAAADPGAKKRFKDLAQECRNYAKAAEPTPAQSAKGS